MRNPALIGAIGLLLALAATPVATRAEDAEAQRTAPPGGATPAAVVQRFREALESQDAAAWVACLEPRRHPHLVLGLLYALAFFEPELRTLRGQGSETLDAEVRTLCAGLGLSEAALRLPHYDRDLDCADHAVTYFLDVDLAALLDKARALAKKTPQPNRFRLDLLGEGELEDLRTRGPWAAGRIGRKPVGFHRVDERWFLVPGPEPIELYVPGFPEVAARPVRLLLDLVQVEALEGLLKGLPARVGDGVLAGTLMSRAAASTLQRPSAPAAGDPWPDVLPNADTFAFLETTGSAASFLRSAVEAMFDPQLRALLDANLRQQGKAVSLDGLLEPLGTLLGTSAVFALARDGAHFNGVTYAGFFPDPQVSPDPPGPVLLIALALAPDAVEDDVRARVGDLLQALGVPEDLEPRSYRDVPYTRVHPKTRVADDATLTPAYAVLDGALILTTSEPYLQALIDTHADPRGHPPLATRATFREAFAQSPDLEGQTMFVDLASLLLVPPPASVGPGGYLWDRRHDWVVTQRGARAAAIEERSRLVDAFREEHGRPPQAAETDAIDQQVETFVEAWQARYAEFEGTYRTHLVSLARLRSLRLTIRESPRHIASEMRLATSPPSDPPR